MLADKDTLLGKLQRGRGEAVRQLLTDPPADANDIVLQCLCTPDPSCRLVQQVEGYLDLLFFLRPPLTRWFDHIRSIPPVDDVQDSEDFYSFRLLAFCVKHGYPGTREFFEHYLLHGAQWQTALDQAAFEVDIPEEVWRDLLPKMSDDQAQLFVADDELWGRLAKVDERARTALAWRREADRAHAWSPEHFAEAEYSARRRLILRSGFEDDPNQVKEQLLEGLWDAASGYRSYCIERVDLGLAGVRERLQEISDNRRDPMRALAQKRLAADVS